MAPPPSTLTLPQRFALTGGGCPLFLEQKRQQKLATKHMKSATEASPLVEGRAEAPKTWLDTVKENLQVGSSIAALVSVAVLKTQLTAFLFRSSNFPTAYSFWSCLVTCVMLVPIFVLSPLFNKSTWSWPQQSMATNFALIVFFTAFDLGFTNIALANISTALQQCIASTNPFWTIVIETALYQRWQHALVYFAVIGLVSGAALASLGSDATGNPGGVIAAVVAVLCSASKYVFTHKAFRTFKGEMGALALLFWVDLFMMPIYIVWVTANGELTGYFAEVRSASDFWQMTGTAALGGVRALTQYVVLIFVSATSMSTANIFTQILNIIISIPLQNTPVSAELGAGIALVVFFSGFYALTKSNRQVLAAFDEHVVERCRRGSSAGQALDVPPAGNEAADAASKA
jgi:hypothetical protein